MCSVCRKSGYCDHGVQNQPVVQLINVHKLHAANYEQNVGGTYRQTSICGWDFYLYRMDPKMQLDANTRGYANMKKSFNSQFR